MGKAGKQTKRYPAVREEDSALPGEAVAPKNGADLPVPRLPDVSDLDGVPLLRLPSKKKKDEEIIPVTVRMPRDLVQLLDAIVESDPDYSRHEVILHLLRVGGIVCLAQQRVGREPHGEESAAAESPPASPPPPPAGKKR